jgi:hypothetical protein
MNRDDIDQAIKEALSTTGVVYCDMTGGECTLKDAYYAIRLLGYSPMEAASVLDKINEIKKEERK